MSESPKKVLFISHATEDSDFVKWLSSRLQMMGYTVWLDLEKLHGGERDFWGVIDDQMRNHSCKFLFVVSTNTFLANGVLKEFRLAESIAQDTISDFITPLRIENVPFNTRIGLNLYTGIDFITNWAVGLNKLVDKLKEDNVPHNADSIINKAFLDTVRRPIKSEITPGLQERHYTNWWPTWPLPPIIYWFQYERSEQAKAIQREVPDFPVIRLGNILVSFEDKMPSSISEVNINPTIYTELGENVTQIFPSSTGFVETQKILDGYDSDVFPKQREAETLLKRLLTEGLNIYMRKHNVWQHFMSTRQKCYYFPIGFREGNKVLVHYPNRTKRKNLIGKQKDGTWHFGISVRVNLHPIVCFSIKSHVLFSNDGRHIWTDANKLHSARRKKGKSWFNQHWRDQLMAFLTALKPSQEEDVQIRLSSTHTVSMPTFTMNYTSDFGYMEPKGDERQNVLKEYEDIDPENTVESEIEVSTNGVK